MNHQTFDLSKSTSTVPDKIYRPSLRELVKEIIYDEFYATKTLEKGADVLISEFTDRCADAILHLVEESENESIAWCECGDALETKPIMKKLDKPVDFGTGTGSVTEIIDHYEYYCFGCDKTYKLVEILKKIKER